MTIAIVAINIGTITTIAIVTTITNIATVTNLSSWKSLAAAQQQGRQGGVVPVEDSTSRWGCTWVQSHNYQLQQWVINLDWGYTLPAGSGTKHEKRIKESKKTYLPGRSHKIINDNNNKWSNFDWCYRVTTGSATKQRKFLKESKEKLLWLLMAKRKAKENLNSPWRLKR